MNAKRKDTAPKFIRAMELPKKIRELIPSYSYNVNYLDEDKTYTVSVEEFVGCLARGNSPAEAMKMAHSTVEEHLTALFSEQLPIPKPLAKINSNQKMIVIGIDPSLNSTGVAILSQRPGEKPDLIHSESIILNKNKGTPQIMGIERLQYIRNQVAEILAKYPPAVVLIEGYSFGSRGRAIFNLGELGGILRVLIADLGIKLIEMAPSELKRKFTGKGNADKAQMAATMKDHYGLEFKTDDEVDAAALGFVYLMPKEAQKISLKGALRKSSSS